MTRFEIEQAVRAQQARLGPTEPGPMDVLYDIKDVVGRAMYGSPDARVTTRDTLIRAMAAAHTWLEAFEEPGKAVDDPLSPTWCRILP